MREICRQNLRQLFRFDLPSNFVQHFECEPHISLPLDGHLAVAEL